MALFVLWLLPSLAAIWLVPWFVTQDGPAHLYNAHIISESLRPGSPFRDTYEVHWQPLPNWAGHLMLVGLLQVMPPWAADRVMMTVTLVGFAAAVAWLRWRVAGWRGMELAAPLAVLLALNVMWLFGFASFLLGACLFAVTLGVWWAGRERMGPGHAFILAALIVLGYFCHPVSLGLTVVGLGVLALTTPGPGRARQWVWTAVGLLPLVVLGVIYRRLTQAGGTMKPVWGHLKDLTSPASWASQFGWVDPLSLGSKTMLPFFDIRSRWCGLIEPVTLFLIALALFVVATLLRAADRRDPDEAIRVRRGWALLAGLLLLGGLLGPDSFGEGHGNYLPQRVLLLGLVAVLPFLDLDRSRPMAWVGGLALALALAMQSAFVWDYALYSDRTAGAIARSRPFVGRGQRIGTLLLGIRGLFRTNPLLHIDNVLGVDTGNVVWSNYETIHYYFPVQYRDPDRHPHALDFEAIAMHDDPEEAPDRARYWERLLERYHDQIDVLVVWGAEPALDAINERWFEPRVRFENVRILRHRADGSSSRAGRPGSP